MREFAVIIAGFHHSGTRLVARMLSAMGVFQVIDRPTYEWGLVQQTNDAICPAWCDPAALARWLERGEAARSDAARVDVAGVAAGMRAAGYAGGVWGVKDPRLCLTAPAWGAAFGGARMVFIYRDPVAVLGTFPAGYAGFTPGGVAPSLRLDFWSALYEQYYVSMRRQCLVADDVIELRYEDLVAAPERSLTRVAVRLGFDDVAARVAAAVAANPINRKRANRLGSEVDGGRVAQSGLELIRQQLAPVRRALGYGELAGPHN